MILAKFSLILAYLLELFLDFKKNILLAEARIKAQKERDKLTNIIINEVNSTFKECFLNIVSIKNALRPNSIKSLEACYKNYFS